MMRTIAVLAALAAATLAAAPASHGAFERRAANARHQASTARARHDPWAAYLSELRAYRDEISVNALLERQLAYQAQVIERQARELAQRQPAARTAPGRPASVGSGDGSYGWGTP